MYKLIRPLIFKASSDPETMHGVMMKLLHMVGNFPIFSWIERLIFDFQDERLKQNIFGLEFKNPVGLAGGFDKQAEALQGFANLGFGFLEVGTVTQLAQPGNPRQRIFRLVDDEALINRMGFNNHGADAMSKQLSQTSLYLTKAPIGVNLGKSKITELNKAAEDYLYSFTRLYEYGDYFVVNVSSPNTPGLRELQDKNFLIDILSGLTKYRSEQKIAKPILVKIAPDLSFEAIEELVPVCKQYEINGVIATNTTVGRVGLKTETKEIGGLSGKPVKEMSTAIIKHIHQKHPSMPIIGVGGIFSAEDAYEKIKAGASLVQIYTGLIYEGPGLVKKINKGLVELLKRDGFKNISEAVGVETK